MRFLRHLPIKRKLTIITMVTSCLALLLACAAFAVYEQAAFRKTMARDLAIIADMFDDNVSSGLAFNDRASVDHTLNTLRAHPRIAAACVYDAKGKIFGSYQREHLGSPFHFPESQPQGQHFTSDRLDSYEDIFLAGEFLGRVYIGSDLTEVSERIWRYTLIVGVLLLGCSGVAFLVASRLQRVISGPIIHLEKVAATVASENNYAIRAVKEGEDEVGRLIDRFNAMLNQIQERDLALQEAHDQLERRVDERTGQLKAEMAERTRVAEAFAASEGFLHSLVENLPVFIYRKDLAGRFTFANRLYCERKGRPIDEILGRTDFDFISREHAEKHLADDQRVIATGRIYEGTEEQIQLNGDKTYIQIIKVPVMDGKDHCIGTQGMYMDVTHQKLAEEALRNSELKFRQFAENIREVFWMTTPGMDEIIYVSPAYLEVWGRSTESLYQNPRGWLEAIVPEDRSSVVQACQDLSGTHPSYDIEYRILRPDGVTRWIRDRAVQVLDDHGRVYRTAGVASDITERKAAEAELEEAHRQLVDTSRQAGMAEVATGVLHNVGNVLNSVNVSVTLVSENLKKSKVGNLARISAMFREHAADLGAFLAADPKGKQLPGYLDQLADYLVSEQTAQLKELESLKKNIEHIKDIVAMQQSYAKVSGVSEQVNITDLIEDTLRMNASALSRHEVTVVREYGPELPPINVEKHKVLQILVNLVRNAKHACDDSGKTEKQMTVRVARIDHVVRITVADNGIGIAADHLTRIFSHGFTTKKTGHGFGLHSGALAAREMGGSLSVHSDGPGRGAAFTLELPCE